MGLGLGDGECLRLAMPVPKRSRPPNINLSMATHKRDPVIQLETESPLQLSDDEDLGLEGTVSLQRSSSSTSPIIPSVNLSPPDEDSAWEELSKDLAALEQLRKSVRKNLRLRPIRSHSALPKATTLNTDLPTITNSPFPQRNSSSPLSDISPPSSSVSSYFTPLSEILFSSAPPTAQSFKSNSTPCPCPIQPETLHTRLSSSRRPLLIDTRPPSSHISFHVRHSINIAIPSLILKRCRKPGGGFQSLDALRQFITTEGGKQSWDEMISSDTTWDGDVIIYDDEMDPKDKDNVGVTAWALILVLTPLVSGHVDYLQGGISAAGHHPGLQSLVMSGGELGITVDSASSSTGGLKNGNGHGLSQLDTPSVFRSKVLLEIESSSPSNDDLSPPPRTPLPQMPGAIVNDIRNIIDPTPSPPPSQISFRRPQPLSRRPSVPSLRRLDTKSAEPLNGSLPKLSLRTRTVRSATLAVPPSQLPTSPTHLNLVYSNHSPPGSARWTPTSPSNDPSNYLTPYYTPPHTPGTPKSCLVPSPVTARPELDPPTTEEAFPVFSISTILPNFLYLGPEVTDPEHVEELQDLGVKRILNIAAECDDDNGLKLKEVFDKYYKIPMRDIVEEENIARGVKEACEILDDARLHSAPTYVHCKAGKSRSVTAVMAYLIHANHWTLSRAYSFVLERRKGISPNIGFVSVLMNFEEQKLGGKSVGVHTSAPAGTSQHDPAGQQEYSNVVGSHHRRGGHVRESLPPALGGTEDGAGGIVPMSAGGLLDRINGDSGQEMEIKDASGRYRHARRAPVDENTLQPLRRVSKAGLESSAYS